VELRFIGRAVALDALLEIVVGRGIFKAEPEDEGFEGEAEERDHGSASDGLGLFLGSEVFVDRAPEGTYGGDDGGDEGREGFVADQILGGEEATTKGEAVTDEAEDRLFHGSEVGMGRRA
jgi:hypothetical protein